MSLSGGRGKFVIKLFMRMFGMKKELTPILKPGDSIQTHLGTGTVYSYNEKDDSYVVRVNYPSTQVQAMVTIKRGSK